MAYAAGVPDERIELFDTTRPLVVHPMFPVAPEWGLLIAHPAIPGSMVPNEVGRGVHAAHDLILERPVRVGERLTITNRVVAVGQRRGGACQQVLFEAADEAGAPVWRTMMTSVFRGVALDGAPRAVEVGWPSKPTVGVPDAPLESRSSVVGRTAAHVYSECARIWNPIHTDVAVAVGVGLPAPILHGTATLARAVSACAEMAQIPLADVRRVVGSFAATVPLDSTIEVRLLAFDGCTAHFDVLNADGEAAIRGGAIVTGSSSV
jgi:acyl dehydratase